MNITIQRKKQVVPLHKLVTRSSRSLPLSRPKTPPALNSEPRVVCSTVTLSARLSSTSVELIPIPVIVVSCLDPSARPSTHQLTKLSSENQRVSPFLKRVKASGPAPQFSLTPLLSGCPRRVVRIVITSLSSIPNDSACVEPDNRSASVAPPERVRGL